MNRGAGDICRLNGELTMQASRSWVLVEDVIQVDGSYGQWFDDGAFRALYAPPLLPF